ncbi:hypothetical protein [Methylobacterium trifolii]|uniref:Uncharacterized protein n=1 Tax=Methylobacterium trifolii TaxID=1003092 RepID=A0ABQ4U5U6_9HYPH|nr:hypothetical protein [Methylobacterium trifolii]GJE62651.1 hypothetical protein MPOCJGCO_4785 [Methylobacterium trifolii]
MFWPKVVIPVFLACTAPAWAGKAETPTDLISTRTAFAAAVSANNEAGAAALTSFPLKNTVYKEAPKLTRKAFSALFADYRHMAACIRTTPLMFERGAWLIDCDGNILRFGVRGGRWLHTEYENVNE